MDTNDHSSEVRLPLHQHHNDMSSHNADLMVIKDNNISTIFDKIPSKRKLVRETKEIKVNFGNFKTKLMGPRKYCNPDHSD